MIRDTSSLRVPLLAVLWPIVLMTAMAPLCRAGEPGDRILPPTSQQWTALARLPDWSGIWTPDKGDQARQERSNPPPWNSNAVRRIVAMHADAVAGHPDGILTNCLPYGMPSLMLVTHNALEFLFTPGRVTVLGESDGNQLRRIYTDGRAHPADPDPSFFGDSIAHWEGDTLAVDTLGIFPQALIAVSEAAGIPSNGDMHVAERIHLVSEDVMHDDLTIIAPHVLTRPWATTRIFYRQRSRKYEIQEGVCLEGRYRGEVDRDGYAVFAPIKFAPDGSPEP